ncbi:MAG: hypothetical protein ACO2O0_04250 [Desulfurococcales archaeon]
MKTLRSKIDASVIASSTASHYENVRVDAKQVLIFSSRSPFQWAWLNVSRSWF